MLLKFQGLRAATQYEITRAIDNYPRFLAIYEFEDQKAFEAFELSPELAAALKEAEETWAEGDLKIMWLVSYNTVRTWRK
jgi:quinol monooxygenase YgiN